MKRISLFMTALVFSSCGVSQAQQAEPTRLGVDLDATCVTQYLWRGYDLYDDHGAFQPSINMDLFGSGFSVNIWGSVPIGSGYEDLTELDYTLAYGTSLFAEETYALDIAANYIYFNYPKLNHMANVQEIGVSTSMPNLLSISDIAIVPSYYVGQLWPNSSGVSGVAGGFHILGLSFDLPVPCPAGEEGQQVFSFFADMTYNDGAFAADHDWSHSTCGVSTSFAVGPATVTPSLNYQVSMDDSVNDEDELWAGVSMSIGF